MVIFHSYVSLPEGTQLFEPYVSSGISQLAMYSNYHGGYIPVLPRWCPPGFKLRKKKKTPWSSSIIISYMDVGQNGRPREPQMLV